MREKQNAEPQLVAEVRSLLDHHDQASDFLESPAQELMSEKTFGKMLAPYQKGDRIDDFIMERVLGRGAFGTVYLAKQLSLNRQIALKVSANLGEEAKALARLDHDHIVKVYSQRALPDLGMRLLCLQYVPGTSLQDVLENLPDNWTPKTLLDYVESKAEQTKLDPVGIRERNEILSLDREGYAHWVGIRLARALAYAHKRGILHLDVKPANILMNPYGRPLLSDFNVSVDQGTPGNELVLGGTKEFMAPEQSALLTSPSKSRALNNIDGRCDVYSLAKVLQSIVGGSFASSEFRDLLLKATEKDPSKRFSCAKDFAEALENCFQWKKIQSLLPAKNGFTRLLERYPAISLMLGILLPSLAGSAINISYNDLRIVSHQSAPQQALFTKLVMLYNLVVYPSLLVFVLLKLHPLLCYFRKEKETCLESARKLTLSLPNFVLLIVSLGWVPGAFFFPWTIHIFEGPLEASAFSHFYVSFLLSWLVAGSYAYVFIHYLALRVIYPKLCWKSHLPYEHAASEVKKYCQPAPIFYYLIGLAPLIGVLLITLSDPHSAASASHDEYHFLVTFLTFLAAVGFLLALSLVNQTSRLAEMLTSRR